MEQGQKQAIKPGDKDPVDAKQPAKKNEKKEEELLTEEDLAKKQNLELLVTRVQDPDEGLVHAALVALRNEIASSTSSMTAVPKPLKFLRPHFDTLRSACDNMKENVNKKDLADIVSVLAMTVENKERLTLKYRLLGVQSDATSWGHEYLRHLANEIAQEYADRLEKQASVDDLLKIVDEIVPYNVTHNAEPEACDLLMEVDRLDRIVAHADEHNYQRICLYLSSCASYVTEPEDTTILNVVLQIYTKMKELPRAMQIALRMNNPEQIKAVFDSAATKDPANPEQYNPLRRQLAFMAGRQYVFDLVDIDSEEDRQVVEALTNSSLPKYFQHLQKDIQMNEPKEPEDIYKSHLAEGAKQSSAKVDSARQNLASTFVNAFVNAGSGADKLMTVEGTNNWLYKNKEHGMMSAAASIGMLWQWEVGVGLTEIDKFLYSKEEWVQAGALLGVGILHAGVRSEFDPAFGLLSEYVTKDSVTIKTAAALGLGLAYGGSNRPEVRETLRAVFDDPSQSMEVLGMNALALGLICVGTCDPDLTEAFVGVYVEKSETQLKNTWSRFVALGLGLLYLGKKEASELAVEALKAAPGPLGKFAALTVETLAYAGTGNVLKVQRMLHECNEHLEKDNEHQAVAVLGIALIAMTEEIGIQMVLRAFDRLLQYGEQNIRKAVPLAISLLCVGNPEITVMDILSKLSHDHDAEVAQGAIFALGMIGVGTNNSRIAQLLRQLASYYYKEPNHLFMVRIAQGLLHMGKGTISIKPTHSQAQALNPAALGGIIALVSSCLDLKGLLLGKSHYLLYLLAPAMQPRMLLTVNEDLEPVPVSVRVGQAIDVVGQPGKPKTITGFQTHTTPVLIGHAERAELATEEFIAVTDILEGIVIVKKNPDYKVGKEDEK